jgi:hypothetical protein
MTGKGCMIELPFVIFLGLLLAGCASQDTTGYMSNESTLIHTGGEEEPADVPVLGTTLSRYPGSLTLREPPH